MCCARRSVYTRGAVDRPLQIKYNGEMISALESCLYGDRMESFLDAISSNIVDSNVMMRAVILTFECRDLRPSVVRV